MYGAYFDRGVNNTDALLKYCVALYTRLAYDTVFVYMLGVNT